MGYGYLVGIVVYKATTVVYYNLFPFKWISAMAVKRLRFGLFCLVWTVSWAVGASDDLALDNKAERDSKITVAVASNFLSTMKQLVDAYEKDTGRVVRLSGGSTGKHYAQILHGAPFDLFFAADDLRPKLLEDKQVGIKGSRFTYAEGALVIWSPEIPKTTTSITPPLDQEALAVLLASRHVKTLAMANPKLAPYGRAAQDVINVLLPGGLTSAGGHKIRVIRGENISQTFQFVMSGTADLAFIAHSQVLDRNLTDSQKERYKMISEHYRVISNKLHQPIRQQAIRLNDKESTRRFVSFIKSAVAKNIIESNGYRVVGAVDAG